MESTPEEIAITEKLGTELKLFWTHRVVSGNIDGASATTAALDFFVHTLSIHCVSTGRNPREVWEEFGEMSIKEVDRRAAQLDEVKALREKLNDRRRA